MDGTNDSSVLVEKSDLDPKIAGSLKKSDDVSSPSIDIKIEKLDDPDTGAIIYISEVNDDSMNDSQPPEDSDGSSSDEFQNNEDIRNNVTLSKSEPNCKIKVEESKLEESNGVTRIKKYYCIFCSEKFHLKSVLRKHMATAHRSERQFSCPQCDKKFFREHYMRIHLRSHTTEKPFLCELCDYKFTKKHRLDSHIRRSHTQRKDGKDPALPKLDPFLCQLCSSENGVDLKYRSCFNPGFIRDSSCLIRSILCGLKMSKLKSTGYQRLNVMKKYAEGSTLSQEVTRLCNEVNVTISPDVGLPPSSIDLFINADRLHMFRIRVYTDKKDHTQYTEARGRRSALSIVKTINIVCLKNTQHYILITDITKFFNESEQCPRCLVLFSGAHPCSAQCQFCFTYQPCRTETTNTEPISCQDCNRQFLSRSCLQRHKNHRYENSKTICDLYFVCTDCGQSVDYRARTKRHACGEFFCKVCKQVVSKNHTH